MSWHAPHRIGGVHSGLSHGVKNHGSNVGGLMSVLDGGRRPIVVVDRQGRRTRPPWVSISSLPGRVRLTFLTVRQHDERLSRETPETRVSQNMGADFGPGQPPTLPLTAPGTRSMGLSHACQGRSPMSLRRCLNAPPPALIALALLLALMGGAAWRAWRDRLPPPLPSAQTPYRQGVPQATPGAAFFPIGLYHALDAAHAGETLSLAEIAAAGFNAVHVWEGLRLEPVLSQARAHGLRLLFHHPTDDEVRTHAGDPQILAWYLDEEPSLHVPLADQDRHRQAFLARREQLRRIDPGHPVLALDMAALTGTRRADWIAWAGLGDISAHDNYPIRWFPHRHSLDTPGGIPASVSLAVRMVAQRKPVWLVVQAMAGPEEGWRMPTPEELRAMVFAGLVHGATGLFYFALDSFVTREGQILGIAPDPAPAYALPPGFGHATPPLMASPEDRAASRRLWQAVVALNRELQALAPDLLAATATATCTATVPGRPDAPIRTLLKERDGHFTLLAVNLERSALPVRFSCTLPQAPVPWETVFAPLETRIVREPILSRQ